MAAPEPPCHCEAVNARPVNARPVNAPVSAGTRRACLLLAVAGALVPVAGVLLGVVSAVLGQAQPGGRFPASVISVGLIAAGLFCGVIVVAVN